MHIDARKNAHTHLHACTHIHTHSHTWRTQASTSLSNHAQQDLEEARQALKVALKERVFQEVKHELVRTRVSLELGLLVRCVCLWVTILCTCARKHAQTRTTRIHPFTHCVLTLTPTHGKQERYEETLKALKELEAAHESQKLSRAGLEERWSALRRDADEQTDMIASLESDLRLALKARDALSASLEQMKESAAVCMCM